MHLIITFYKYCTYIPCCSFFIYAHKYPRGFRLGHFDYWYLLLVCCYNRLRHIPMWEEKKSLFGWLYLSLERNFNWTLSSSSASFENPNNALHWNPSTRNPKRDIPILSFPLTLVILPLCPLQEFLPNPIYNIII